MAYTKGILIIGGSGFIGTHLALKLRENFRVYATYSTRKMSIPGVTFFPARAENGNWIRTLVYALKPDVIIYAAGSNRVESAELATASEIEVKLSEQVHTGGPVHVIDAIGSVGSKLIYLSNCYVFEGSKGNYREPDTLIPALALGKNKVGGENFIRSKCSNYVIIRSSPLLGRGPGLNLTFFEEWRRKFENGETVNLSSNELHSFTHVKTIVQAVERLVDGGIKNKTLHVGGLTRASWYDLGCMVAKKFGFSPGLVVATSDRFESDYSLNSTQVATLLKIKPLFLEESLDLFHQQLVSGA